MKRTLLAIMMVSLMVGPVGCKSLFEPERDHQNDELVSCLLGTGISWSSYRCYK